MNYKKLKADKIFDGYRFHTNKVLILHQNGSFADLVIEREAGENIEQYNGIISPGLVNCHCHLELSHLKNVIPPHTGLIEFLCSVVTKRDFPSDFIQEEIVKAEKEMYDNGIVAVGDIGNTADTATVKSKSKIRWQNFVEVLSFTDEKADENLNHFKKVAQQLIKNYGIEIPLEISGQYRKGDIRHNFADITLIKDQLGFEPKVDFETGITTFCNWVNEQALTEDKYEFSLNEMKAKGLIK